MSNVIDIEAWLRRPIKTDPEDEPEYALDDDRAVYTVAEVARLLALSRGGTYELVRKGVIPAVRLGRRWVIPKARFQAWLDSCTEGGL
jgi:excisionase family DNA binding protein